MSVYSLLIQLLSQQSYKICQLTHIGQCLWLSWLSRRFLYQRSVVRIQSLANFIYFQLY